MHHITKQEFKNTIASPLLQLPDAPDKLFIQGDLQTVAKRKLVTIVGSRTCSNYSKQITKKLIRDLSPYPVCIVSGLALGIDAVAHKAALESHIPTIAFPGSGLDPSVLYPRSHANLAREIISQGGVLISEYEPLTKAARWTFPQRNRLMAGISDLVVIIEAREKSGTLITARLAVEYNKDVAVIPHPIDNVHAIGSNKLMQEGAYPILDYTDILSLLGLSIDEKVSVEHELNTKEQIIYDLLQAPVTKDVLYEQSKIPYMEFIQILSVLELKNIVTQNMGYFQRV